MRGTITNLTVDYVTHETIITAKVRALPAQIEPLMGSDVEIKLSKWRERRGLDANALYWACVGEIAAATRRSREEIHKELLKSYGVYTYVVVRPEAVERLQKEWRATEVLGEINVNGQKGIQCLCFYGSHTYNTAEFSRLLDGVKQEMEQLGIAPPPSRQIVEVLRRVNHNEDNANQIST